MVLPCPIGPGPLTACSPATYLSLPAPLIHPSRAGVTILKLVLIAVVAVAGYTQGGASNMTPFLNTIYDTDGLFLGAAIVFFAHVGFDAVANAAEEVRGARGRGRRRRTLAPRGTHSRPLRPPGQVADVRQLPWAIVGTVALSILIYSCLALALALLVFPGVACPDWHFFLTGSNDASQYVTFISAFINGHCELGVQALPLAARTTLYTLHCSGGAGLLCWLGLSWVGPTTGMPANQVSLPRPPLPPTARTLQA